MDDRIPIHIFQASFVKVYQGRAAIDCTKYLSQHGWDFLIKFVQQVNAISFETLSNKRFNGFA